MRTFIGAMAATILWCSTASAQIEVIDDYTLPGPSENPVAVESWQGDLYYATAREDVTHYGLSSAALPEYPFHQVFDVRDCGSELLILANEWVDSMYYPYYEILHHAFRWDGTTLAKTPSYYSTEVEIGTAGPANIYQGEVFTAGAGVYYPLRRYRGGTWRQISVNATKINALEVIDGYLYTLGNFTSIEAVDAESVARFDGTSWSAFGLGLPGTAQTIAAAGGEYYATTSSELWQWQAHSDTWVKIADAGGGLITDTTAWNNDLVLVGTFSSMDGTPAEFVVKYDGSLFHPIPGGPNGPIDTVSPHGAGFVVEGSFLGTAVDPAIYAAIYDGSTWSPARPGGLGVAPFANRIATYGGDLLVSNYNSELNAPSTTAAFGVARYTPEGWAGLAGGLRGGDVGELLEHSGVLYAQGEFQTTGGVQGWPSVDLFGWATWDGVQWESWTRPPHSVSGEPYAGDMISYQGSVLVASSAYDFGQQELLARWDGDSWSSFPSGSALGGSSAREMYEYDGKLWVAGSRMTTPSLPGEHYVLYWDGVQWHPTNISKSGTFFEWNGDFYITGNWFTGRWDTDHWYFGTGLTPGTTEEILVAGGELYKTSFGTDAMGNSVGILYRRVVDIGWAKILELTQVDVHGNVRSGTISDLITVGDTRYAVGSFTHVNGVRCDNFVAFTGDIAVAVEPAVPARKLAIRAFPNPANPVVSFTLEYDRKGPVWVDIFDLRGRQVRQLVAGQPLEVGSSVVWDGRSDRGEPAASGVYFAHVRYGEESATTKFTLVK